MFDFRIALRWRGGEERKRGEEMRDEMREEERREGEEREEERRRRERREERRRRERRKEERNGAKPHSCGRSVRPSDLVYCGDMEL